MISTIIAGGVCGVEAYLAAVEVDISTGLPGFGMVGSLSGEVREARERVQVALRNTGFDQPPMKITVNLAPANIRKEGTAYDLPIAVGVLQSLGYFHASDTESILFIGELGLDGEIKGVNGVLPIVREAALGGVRCCIVPRENVMEGAVIPGISVRGVGSLRQLVEFLQARPEEREMLLPAVRVDMAEYLARETRKEKLDFSEVCGQEGARRGAEIAAAGFHNLLMIGPPGAGKSMIARRIPGILPPLTIEESLEVSSVYSVAGQLQAGSLIHQRPFQSPHHTISQAAMTGGSSVPRPGAISLAHRGVLFLDELPEFSRTALDSLRQPLEEREVHVARVYGNVTYPADFMLVCSMNPCPCGYYPDKNKCTCTEHEVRKYLGRISGPVLDRIDLCVEILPVEVSRLRRPSGESSGEIRKRVMAARRMQEERYRGREGKWNFNADISAAEIGTYCRLGPSQRRLMEQAYEAMGLSARGYHRTLRVARTIADLAGEEQIREEHLMEALCFRMTDQAYWGRGSSHEAGSV